MRGAEHAREGSTWPDSGPLAGYDHDGFWCELYGGASAPAPHAARVCARLARMDMSELRRRAQAAADELFNLGITFTIYSDRDSIDRILPFDVIPRVLSAEDWRTIESGVQQRVQPSICSCTTCITGGRSCATAWCRPTWCSAMPTSARRCRVSRCRTGSTSTSAASTSCATSRAPSGCSRTTRARRPACPT